MVKKMFVRKNITIRQEQDTWIEKHSLSLSKFVQKKLDEKIKKERGVMIK